MNERMKTFYMTLACQCSIMSRARRLQVGAVVVRDDNILSFGWNGTPAGWDNNCEHKLYITPESGYGLNDTEINLNWPYEDKGGRYLLKTKPEVLHAERNALDKLAKGKESGLGAELFTTHAPCIECAKSIYATGIKTVYYNIEYKVTDGLDFLKKCGVGIEQFKINNFIE